MTGLVRASGGWKEDVQALECGDQGTGVPRFDGDSARMFSIEIVLQK